MPMLVGQPAPQFNLDAVADGQFCTIDLQDYRDQWVVVFFYPLDFTFVCPTEILAFSDRIEEFERLGAQVLGVSVDSKYTHLAWTNTPRNQGGVAGLAYPLIADLNRTMARAFGVLTDEGVALRGLFIIDPDGIVQHATLNNLGVGRSVDETLRVLQAFQFVRDNGDVCPADWQPGDDAMKADPHQSREWFAKNAG